MLDEDEMRAVYAALHATVHMVSVAPEDTELVFALQEEALDLVEDVLRASQRASARTVAATPST